jgi:tRNA pseudouridine55 synthase
MAISGVLIIDKPQGPTSHDVVARVRKAIKSRHVGHAGTLDPMATGVLVVAIGEATKLVPWLTAAAKEYETTIRLGVETDTLDAQGKEVARVPISEVELRKKLDEAIALERARTMQSPPAYSAIKIDGVRAHALARSGRLDADAELPARAVEVSALDVLGIDAPPSAASDVDADVDVDVAVDVVDVRVRVAVSKGYFVRSLARDLARALQTVGHLTALRRTRSGAFHLGDAIAIEAVSATSSALITTTDAAMRALPVTKLNEEGVRAASMGQRVLEQHRVTTDGPVPAGPCVWIDAATSRLVAIGECDAEGVGRVLRGFNDQ